MLFSSIFAIFVPWRESFLRSANSRILDHPRRRLPEIVALQTEGSASVLSVNLRSG